MNSGPCLSIFVKMDHEKKSILTGLFYLNYWSNNIYKKNYKDLKEKVISGLNITCVGDERKYSFLPSRNENGILDKIIVEVLKNNKINYKKYNWKDRGSDERQYCWPNTNLSISSLMRSKYHDYLEYHTSLDKLGNVVTPKGFQGSFNIYKKIINLLETKFQSHQLIANLCLVKLIYIPK